MKVTNNCSYALIAFGVHTVKGYGADVTIPPGETGDVNGPYVGQMGGGSCHIALEGELVCQEAPDDDKGFQVTIGQPLALQSGDRGITVRHHLDKPEQCVADWREAEGNREAEETARSREFTESALRRLNSTVT